MPQVETTLAARQLTELLERVKHGERVLLTEADTPVGMLVSCESESTFDATDIVKGLLKWRADSGPTLGPRLTIRQMIEEGRRY